MAMTQDEIKAFWQGFATSSEGHIILSSITVDGNKIEMIDFDDTDYTGKVVFTNGVEIRITMSEIDSDGKIKRLYLNNGEVTKYIDCVYNGDNLIRVGDVSIRDIESLGITTTANLQSKNVSPSQVSQTVTYDTNYDGLSSVIVAAAILQNKSVTPKKDAQTIAADTGNYGLGTVTVEGDVNLLPENIKKGVSIFGVEGTSEGGEGSGTNITTVSYDEEYNTTFNYEDTTENTFTPEFGEDGNITTITDSEGNVLNCEYDENGNIIKVGDIEINGVDQIPLVSEGNAPIAGLTSIEFKDSDYNVTATDREGMTRDASPTFNEEGNITEINVDGNNIPVEYDQNGVITKVGDVSISGVDLLEMFNKGGGDGEMMIQETLWSGDISTQGTQLTLSKSITDYDLIFFEGRIDVTILSKLIPSQEISEYLLISEFAFNGYYGCIGIQKNTDTSLTVNLTSVSGWSSVALTKVIGIKFTGTKSIDYSEAEQVIGKWIDGKPLYQKTVNINLTENAWITQSIIPNIKQVVNYFGTTNRNNIQTLPLNYYNDNNSFYWCMHFADTDLQYYIKNSTGVPLLSAEITVQYTKTTD